MNVFNPESFGVRFDPEKRRIIGTEKGKSPEDVYKAMRAKGIPEDTATRMRADLEAIAAGTAGEKKEGE
jgi:hypothetical protein